MIPATRNRYNVKVLSMQKILVVSVNWLGDSIFSLPVFENLKSNYPQSMIGVVAPGYLQELYRSSPWVERFYAFSDRAFYKNFFQKIALMRALREEHFDQVFLLHRSFTKALICVLSGIPERIGYRRRKSGRLLTTTAAPPDPSTVHRVDFYLGVLQGAGLRIIQDCYHISLTDEVLQKACALREKMGIGGKSYLCMHTTANWAHKMWGQEKFAALADIVIKEKDYRVFFTGSARERKHIEVIRGMMKYKERAFNLAGMTSLLESAALFKTAKAVVSADSGPLHLAAGVGANTVALFGPTSEAITGPRGIGKSVIVRRYRKCAVPCYQEQCLRGSCMHSIAVEDVLHAAEVFFT